MPTLAALQATRRPVAMQQAFASARRTSRVAENVLCTATLSDGGRGYGEASPAKYVTGETAATVLKDLARVADALVGLEVERWREWSGALREALTESPTARSAVEIALLDALCRSLGLPLWKWFGGATEAVRSDFTVSLATPEDAEERARAAAARGFRTLKVKVGGEDREADWQRVAAVARRAPGCVLRLDANQGFDVEGALGFLSRTQAAGVEVELLEQPLPADDWAGMARLTRRSPVPIIADEMATDARAVARIATERTANGVNLKVAKSGLLGALEMIAVARAHGLHLMLGCMLESLPGLGASVHLACGTGAFDYLDLDSHLLLGLEATGVLFAQDGDRLSVADSPPGLGWTPQP